MAKSDSVQTSSANTDTTNAPQDAPPKPVVEDKDITSNAALKAVAPDGDVSPLPADADYVEYRGKALMRRMTTEQWEQAKVKDQGEVVWDKGNDYKVPLSDLNDAALKALARDPGFAMPEQG